jgi:hypothetical protein
MKKIIIAATAIASLMVMGSAPASALGCTSGWVNGRISQVCDSPVAATLANSVRPRSLPAPRCHEQRVFGTLRTVTVCN